MIVEQMLGGPMAVFSYIVGCEQEKECLIIDPAGSIDSILSRTAELGLTVKYVVNTHGHADHTGGNSALISGTGAKLVAHEEDAGRITAGMNKALSLAMGKRPLYIKTTKGYTPEDTGNKKKDIDLGHTIKRNLLLR